MPRKKSGLYDNKAYQREYHNNMKKLLISFNPNSEDDMTIWEYLRTKANKTGYIKKLILEDKDKSQEEE